MQKNKEAVTELAEKIRSNPDLRETLTKRFDLLSQEEQVTVIHAVTLSGICDDPLVRTIRGLEGQAGQRIKAEPQVEGIQRQDLQEILAKYNKE